MNSGLSPHGFRAPYDPSRRGFLITMIGAGVMLGYARSGLAAVESLTKETKAPLSPNELFEPTIWYGIDTNGVVTVNIIRAEMGQHVGTALARIVADELEADWSKVKIVIVDSDPKWGLMITGGSWSVWQSFSVLSRSGAAGRIALIEEGAKLLGVSPKVCTARNGAGAHQLYRPSRCISAGNNNIRTRVASASTASVTPRPNITTDTIHVRVPCTTGTMVSTIVKPQGDQAPETPATRAQAASATPGFGSGISTARWSGNRARRTRAGPGSSSRSARRRR